MPIKGYRKYQYYDQYNHPQDKCACGSLKLVCAGECRACCAVRVNRAKPRVKWIGVMSDKTMRAARMREYNKTYYPLMKERVFIALGGKVCLACGTTDERILTFDHINGGGCRERKSTGSTGIFHRMIKDPHLYRVLCLNCNWLAHRYGLSPVVMATVV